MKRVIHPFWLLALAVAILSAIAVYYFDNKPVATARLKPEYIEANTAFAFNLMRAMANKEHIDNQVISPASVGMVLCMTLNGAQGGTRDDMLQTLNLDMLTLDEINESSKALLSQLDSVDPAVELAVANSLWADSSVRLQRDFTKTSKQFYSAKAAQLNFKDENASSKINQWVSSRTNGKIPQIVSQPIGTDLLVILISPVYFNGRWTEPFEIEQTRPADFHLLGGALKEVQMMRRSGEYSYMESEELQAVRLPYGSERNSMYLLLPRKDIPFSDFCSGADDNRWNEWMGALRSRVGLVALPRFKLEYEQKLNDALTALGMGVAFNPASADFQMMSQSQESIFIGQVRHKAFIEVNEEGTEAAAATSVGMKSASFGPPEPPKPFEMIVDRPFIFAIRDDATGTILFLGTIVNP